MKKFTILFLFLFTVQSLYSQIEITHLIKYEKTINPIFSKKLNQFSVNFERSNLIDSPYNFIKYLKIDISDRKSELNGSINDFNLGGTIASINNYGIIGGILSSSISNSKFFSYRNTSGSVVLNKKQFDTLFNYLIKIDQIVNNLKKTNLNNDKTFFFQVDKINLNLEVKVSKDNYTNNRGELIESNKIENKIIFKIDESIFIFSENEFDEIFKNIFQFISNSWINE